MNLQIWFELLLLVSLVTSSPQDQSTQDEDAAIASQIDQLFIDENLDFTGDSGALGSRSVGLGSRDGSKVNFAAASDDCPCVNYQKCDWSRKLTAMIGRLSKSNPTRRRAVDRIKKAVCNRRTFGVNCCSRNSPGETSTAPPAVSPPPLTPPSSSSGDKTMSGTWLPTEREGCGRRVTSEFIVSGNDTKPGEIPFMALLAYKFRDTFVYTCGGTIINRRYVLTAAHCFNTSQGNPVHVILGEHVVGPDPDCKDGNCLPKLQTIDIEELIEHPGWRQSNVFAGNDIALIRLKRPASLFLDGLDVSTVAPICLPFEGFDNAKDQVEKNMQVTGWGRVTNDRNFNRENYLEFGTGIRTLQKVEIPIVNPDICASQQDQFKATTQLCAGGKDGKDSCGGDSGGPLSYRSFISKPWYQIGVVSYGPNVCGTQRPAVYTYVPAYVDWIRRTVRP